MTTDGWKPVTKSEPCPICEKPDWCTVGERGVNCMRVESQHKLTNGGWFHPNGSAPQQPRKREPPKRRETDKELHARWAPVAMTACVGGIIDQLAQDLGVSSSALNKLGVGWLLGRCWTIPERNGYGLIVGISTRYMDGTKMCLPGSRRGLTYSETWADSPGPVLVVEGMSDVAAGITLGLATIGRPSNIGGVKYLTRLLGPHPTRKIVVIAERDHKRHQDLADVVKARHLLTCRGCALCWPGLHGAMMVSDALTASLNRRVRWKLLPTNAKDLRQWLTFQHLDISDTAACLRAGGELAKWLS
jgi:hypothetical protein